MIGFVLSLPTKRLGSPNALYSRSQCCTTMRKGSDSENSSSQKRTSGRDSMIPDAMEDTLLQDIKSMRAKRMPGSESKPGSDSIYRVKSLIESILLWDFFLVLGLLGWLVVALVPHFVSKDDTLLDPWLALWQPFIQPVLGVLMLGTIVQGTISFISKN
ncbi:unnamed protein product [Agarophyton chilense]